MKREIKDIVEELIRATLAQGRHCLILYSDDIAGAPGKRIARNFGLDAETDYELVRAFAALSMMCPLAREDLPTQEKLIGFENTTEKPS